MEKLLRLLYKCKIDMNEKTKNDVLFYILDELYVDAEVMNIVNYHLTQSRIEKLITFMINFDDEVSFDEYNDEYFD